MNGRRFEDFNSVKNYPSFLHRLLLRFLPRAGPGTGAGQFVLGRPPLQVITGNR